MRTESRIRLTDAATRLAEASDAAAATLRGLEVANSALAEAQSALSAIRIDMANGEGAADRILANLASGKPLTLDSLAPADGGRARASAEATVETAQAAHAVLAGRHREAAAGEQSAQHAHALALLAVLGEVEGELVARGLQALAELGRVRRALRGLEAAGWVKGGGDRILRREFTQSAILLMQTGEDRPDAKAWGDHNARWVGFRDALKSDPDALPPMEEDPGPGDDELAAFVRGARR
ncbi:hypothetical protein [Phenylobacterium sp.]|uniref:hypothetical protein n=1 Tax=Phenylobacterium sp. TaxID=1871053 RepID=UPI0025DDA7BF|nr:hypothetical protein [Phenylobacterium sp.]